jgi:hypothetical protein
MLRSSLAVLGSLKILEGYLEAPKSLQVLDSKLTQSGFCIIVLIKVSDLSSIQGRTEHSLIEETLIFQLILQL